MFNHSHSCNVIECINHEPNCTSISMPTWLVDLIHCNSVFMLVDSNSCYKLLIGLGRKSHHWLSKAPLQTLSEKSRFGFLNHLSHPHLGIPFLKSVELFCVISTTFTCNCVKVIKCLIACIISMYSTSATSTSICKTLALPLFQDCVMLYKWLHNDVIGTPKFGL